MSFWNPRKLFTQSNVVTRDVVAWKYFPHYWPFVRGIHWSPQGSCHKGPVMCTFDIFCCQFELAVKQTAILLVTLDAMMIIDCLFINEYDCPNLISTHSKASPTDSDVVWRFSYQSKKRKISNIRYTKSQNFNDSRLVLQLSLPNPLKPGVKSRMEM